MAETGGAAVHEDSVCDFLIVGGGTAGCVMANRLSGLGAEVVLLEAGRDTPPGKVPEDISDLYPRSYFNRAYTWRALEADQGADGTGAMSAFTQARVMGGGSSLMGMAALRGVPEDYDGWERAGAAGWSWQDVLPYFRRLERDRDFDGPLHGDEGPVTIRRHHVDDWPPLCGAVGHAARDHGWGLVTDMNGDFGDGYAALPLSATLAHRVSAASAYLDGAARRRPNLRVECRVTVERLVFAGGRCVGAVARADARRTYSARHVVVCAGAVLSPTLLLRSGVGPPDHLAELGIPVVAPLPGVGKNLQNHPIVYLATHLRKGGRQARVLRPGWITALRYSSGIGADRGDMLLLVLNKSSWHGLGEAVGAIGVCLVKPRALGGIRLRSADPREMPDIRFRFATDPQDFQRLIAGIDVARKLLAHQAVTPLRNEMFAAGYSRVVRRLNEPGLVRRMTAEAVARSLDGPSVLRRSIVKYGVAAGDVDENAMRQPEWQERAVREHTIGTYHPAGTCRMGPATDVDAVVDPACSVHGVAGLSVVDASVMPSIVRGNTNLPVTMIAERAAELVAGAADSSGRTAAAAGAR